MARCKDWASKLSLSFYRKCRISCTGKYITINPQEPTEEAPLTTAMVAYEKTTLSLSEVGLNILNIQTFPFIGLQDMVVHALNISTQ